MEVKLEIKFNNQKQIFEILDNEIAVDLNTSKHKLKYKIPLEDIQKNYHIINGTPDKITNRLYASLFLNVFLILYCITIVNNAPPLAIKMMTVLLLLPFVFILIKNNQEYEEKHIESSKLFYFIYTKKMHLK